MRGKDSSVENLQLCEYLWDYCPGWVVIVDSSLVVRLVPLEDVASSGPLVHPGDVAPILRPRQWKHDRAIRTVYYFKDRKINTL